MIAFRREWRWHAKLLRGWLIAIIITLALFLSFYSAFQDGMAGLEAMLAGFPKEVLQGFGIDAATFGSYAGYVAYIYTFVQLLLVLLASLSGMHLIGREKLNKASDFLLSKPVSRASLWLQKIAVGLLGLIIVNGLIGLAIYGLGTLFNYGPDKTILRLLVGSLLVQLIFFLLGTLWATLRPRLRTVTGTASSLSFGFYFLLIIARLLEEDKLYKLSLFGLFDVAQIQRHGFDTTNLIIGLAVIVLLAAGGFWYYGKMDVEV